MRVVFDDAQCDFQTLRLLGSVASGDAEVGEVLSTAARITPGDFGSWTEQWLATARDGCTASPMSAGSAVMRSARERPTCARPTIAGRHDRDVGPLQKRRWTLVAGLWPAGH